MDVRAILALLALFYLALLVRALPVSNNNNNNSKDKEKEVTKEEEKKIESELDDLGLEYGRYLQQVVEALEQDKDFAKKLENVSQEEIKNGAIARELNLVDHRVRNKLDELKRIEMDRLRALAKKEQRLNEGERAWRTLDTPIDADHVDHRNPHSFEAEDLQKLILQATKDLEALDAKRREDFKTYEMEKELRFREDLLNLTETEREARIKEHEQAKHVEHPKVHHPGSKKQLEQVWEEKDGLPAQEFDPKVFFQLHDVNSDGFLDPEEVEAILSVEVRKLYADAQHADQNEVQEEFHRMREHIYKEADANRDGLISKKEFLEFTRRMEFQQDEGWKGLDEQQVFSEEELKRFQQERALHPEEVLRREQMAAYQFQQQQQYNQYYQQQHPQQQHPQQHPNQQYQQYGHPNQMQGFPHAPVQQYLPPPHQMSPQDWAHAQQQYYQQQLHAQQQIPNPQLHQQQQQYQQHAQQQQQQFVQQAAHAQQQQPQYVQVEQMHAQAQQGQHVPVQQMPAHAQMGGGAQHVQQQPQQQQQVHVQQPQGAPLQQH